MCLYSDSVSFISLDFPVTLWLFSFAIFENKRKSYTSAWVRERLQTQTRAWACSRARLYTRNIFITWCTTHFAVFFQCSLWSGECRLRFSVYVQFFIRKLLNVPSSVHNKCIYMCTMHVHRIDRKIILMSDFCNQNDRPNGFTHMANRFETSMHISYREITVLILTYHNFNENPPTMQFPSNRQTWRRNLGVRLLTCFFRCLNHNAALSVFISFENYGSSKLN